MEEENTLQVPVPQLNLDLPDDKLARYIEVFEGKYKEFDKKIKLTERRELNEKYYFGRQLEDERFKNYEKKHVDNVIKEAEDKFRTLVLSRIADIIVNPGVETQISQEVADLISDAINKVLHSDELKAILTLCFRRHTLDYLGTLKYLWDPTEGARGDIVWEVLPGKNVKVDVTATRNDEKYMRVVIHEVEKTLNDWIMLFPKKEEYLKEYAEKKGWQEENDPDGIAFNIKVSEAWFDWKDKAEDFDPENPQYDFKSGVLWKVGKGEKSILDKRLNPNWDWDGEERLFFNGEPVPDEMLPRIAMLGFDVPGLERKKLFRNFFSRPRKPFIFMGYEQYGEMPFDAISRIEDARFMQDHYDKRGTQITKMLDDAKGKHVFSTMSGLTKDTVEEMDLNDPDQDVVVDGDLRQVHAFISKEQPSNAMFADLSRSKDRIKEKFHVAGAAGGEITSDTATTNQIQREASFTVADDFSDLAINRVVTQMAEALLHMMKLRYTTGHFQALIGKSGEEVQDRLNWDMIEDGLELTIFASGTDKLKAERMAKEEASLGIIDPINYFKDTGRSNPETRAEMLYLFQTNPAMYIEKHVHGRQLTDVAKVVDQQNQANLAQFGGRAAQVPQTGAQPSPQAATQVPETPQGSPRSLMGRAGQAVSQLFSRGG